MGKYTIELEFRYGVSRGRDTYGYNICSLYVGGRKVSSCKGGGYDMKGTALGNWVARRFADRLRALKPKQMPSNSHWERAENPRRVCKDCYRKAVLNHTEKEREDECFKNFEYGWLPGDAVTCPECGKETDVDYLDGKRINDGRYLYGLTYHDPNYNPGKAVIGKDCSDRTFSGKSEGKTVEEAEKDGDTVGLERYQAFYSASSKIPTERHTVPLINGGCGFSSVEKILDVIGCRLEWVNTRSKKHDVYVLLCGE